MEAQLLVYGAQPIVSIAHQCDIHVVVTVFIRMAQSFAASPLVTWPEQAVGTRPMPNHEVVEPRETSWQHPIDIVCMCVTI